MNWFILRMNFGSLIIEELIFKIFVNKNIIIEGDNFGNTVDNKN